MNVEFLLNFRNCKFSSYEIQEIWLSRIFEIVELDIIEFLNFFELGMLKS